MKEENVSNRKRQIDSVVEPATFSIKIGSDERETDWLDVTDDELQRIREILT